MSADTSIGYAKFPDGWRHTWVCQAIENVNYKWWIKEIVVDYFWDSPIYKTKEDCLDDVMGIYTTTDDYIEHWIIDCWEFNFII